MEKEFDRLVGLIGEDNFNKITSKKVIVFGVGGVGGYVVESLVRCGVTNLTIVDFDKVNITNINRQIIATHSNLNKFKVDAFKERLIDINPNLNLKINYTRLTKDNIHDFNLSNYNYVIDCIDSFQDKLALIEYCYKNKINILSSMGAGNRYKPTNYQVQDIFKTKNDSLARKLRINLKKLGINKLKVCCSDTISDNIQDKTKIFSVSYNVALCGITISSYIINDIIKK
ncbi:MAG: tRNA threonylcarbamoyladenosine dehydratase [Clostridiales bacterium]|nr:tRNA threonylcarbamoyladenosine dehydratase [Clostridiales bacterium]